MGREKKIFEIDFVGKVEIARRRGRRSRKTPLFEGMKATALLGGDALARSPARSCSCALAGRSEELNAEEGGRERKLYEEEMVTSSTYHFPEAGFGRAAVLKQIRVSSASAACTTDEGLEILKNERLSLGNGNSRIQMRPRRNA